MTFVGWYFGQLAAHPLLFLAVQAGVILAICCGLATFLDRIDDRRELRCGIRDLEHYANHPANRRREKP